MITHFWSPKSKTRTPALFYHRPPGGGIEKNEAPEQAVRRKLQEELGITLSAIQALGSIDHIWFWKGREIHERAWLFLADSSEHPHLKDGKTPEILEADGDRFTAYWRSIREIDDSLPPIGPSTLLQFLPATPDLSACGIVFIEPLLAPNPFNLCRMSCLKRTIQAR